MKPSRWTALWVQWKARVPGRGPTLDRTDGVAFGARSQRREGLLCGSVPLEQN
jgi:hypothetical protein